MLSTAHAKCYKQLGLHSSTEAPYFSPLSRAEASGSEHFVSQGVFGERTWFWDLRVQELGSRGLGFGA